MNIPVNSIPNPAENTSFKDSTSKKIGAITPAVNQATEILPKISAKSCFCPDDNPVKIFDWGAGASRRDLRVGRFGMAKGMIAAGRRGVNIRR